MALLDAAEKLIAEQGVDRVSLRDIAKHAGQRNNSAVAYHFGGRAELMEQVFVRRLDMINVRRAALLATMDAEGRGSDLRSLVDAVLAPLVEHMREAGTGSTWASFMTRALPSLAVDSTGSALHRELGSRTVAQLSHLPAPVAHARLRLAFSMAVASLAAWEQSVAARRVGDDLASLDVLQAHLLDMTVGALLAPAS